MVTLKGSIILYFLSLTEIAENSESLGFWAESLIPLFSGTGIRILPKPLRYAVQFEYDLSCQFTS